MLPQALGRQRRQLQGGGMAPRTGRRRQCTGPLQANPHRGTPDRLPTSDWRSTELPSLMTTAAHAHCRVLCDAWLADLPGLISRPSLAGRVQRIFGLGWQEGWGRVRSGPFWAVDIVFRFDCSDSWSQGEGDQSAYGPSRASKQQWMP